MAKSESKEVAVKQSSEVAIPDFIDLGAGALTGFEGADVSAYAIPFVSILQKMSPAVDEDSTNHIEGAKAGMFINSVTKALIDGKEGMLIIPCAYKRVFIRWGSRKSTDPGFKGQFTPSEVDKLKEEGKVRDIEGKLYHVADDGTVDEEKADKYVDTREHYIIVVDQESGEFVQAVFPLASTQVKSSRTLMTLLQQKKIKGPNGLVTPPSFASVVRATTAGRQNESGSWSVVEFKWENYVADRDLYSIAREFAQSIADGTANADYTKAPDQSAEVESAPKTADGF